MKNQGFKTRLLHRNAHTAGDGIIEGLKACLVCAILHLVRGFAGKPSYFNCLQEILKGPPFPGSYLNKKSKKHSKIR